MSILLTCTVLIIPNNQLTVHTLFNISFPTLIPFNGIRHFGAVPTAPVTPARRSKASRGEVWGSLEVPRPHLGSLDDLRARWRLP